MKRIQILVLMIAVTAGLGATILIRAGKSPAPEPVVMIQSAPAEMVEILVAAEDLPMWRVLARGDLRWQPWPRDNIPEGAITRDHQPASEQEIYGQMTRTQFVGGEPLRMGRLMESWADAGFMSAILPPGKRALAIAIDTRGTTSAGGFIHPNDRVDIIRIFREEDKQEERPSNVFLSETLLTNIRVLAIGQAVQNSADSISIHADTATVEVTPAQAEALALAQRTGQLTLVLRSFADTQNQVTTAELAQRTITVTAGGSGGFNSSRFVVAQRWNTPSEIAPFSPTHHADSRFRRTGGIAAVNWNATMPSR
jgi:pilus assembly protein CpaB